LQTFFLVFPIKMVRGGLLAKRPRVFS
jgi:hypothetical protein